MKKSWGILVFLFLIGGAIFSPIAKALEGGQTAPVVISGSAGGWMYRCVFPAINPAQGPQVCLMQQTLVMQGNRGKTESLGAVILARATESVMNDPLIGRPWRLTTMVPLALSLKKNVRVTLDDNVPMTLQWQSCVVSGCMASLDLSAEQIAQLKAGKTGHIVVDKVGKGTLTINFALDGSNAAMQQLDGWIQKPPFRQ